MSVITENYQLLLALAFLVFFLIGWRKLFGRPQYQLTKHPMVRGFVSYFQDNKVISFAKLSLFGVQWKITYIPRAPGSANPRQKRHETKWQVKELCKEAAELSVFDSTIELRKQGMPLPYSRVAEYADGRVAAFIHGSYRYEIHELKAKESHTSDFIVLSGAVIIKDYLGQVQDRFNFKGVQCRYCEDLLTLRDMAIWLFEVTQRRVDLFGDYETTLL